MNGWEISPRQEVKSGHSAATSPKSDSFMSTSTYFQGGSADGRASVPNQSDQTIMARYVMVCVELERAKKLIERHNALARTVSTPVPADYQLLKLREQSRNKQVGHFKEETQRLQLRIRELEQLSREKDRIVGAKEQELRNVRQQLSMNSLGVSKAEVNQRNRIRELENELLFERSKTSSITKRKEEVDAQVKQLLGKEQTFVRGSADYEIKIRRLEEELKQFRLQRDKESVRSQHSPDSLLRKELEELRTKYNQYKFEAERNKHAAQRLREFEIENMKLRKEHQEAVNQVKVMDIEMRNRVANAEVQQTGKGFAADSEIGSLKRTITSLEAKIQNISSNLTVRERQFQAKVKECEALAQQGDSMRQQISQLVKKSNSTVRQPQPPNRVQQCNNCAVSKEESTALLQKIYGLEKQLRQAQTKFIPPPLPRHKERTDHIPDHVIDISGQRGHIQGTSALSDLLLSAQQIKNSNTRVDQLLETSSHHTSRSHSRGSLTSRAYRPRYY